MCFFYMENVSVAPVVSAANGSTFGWLSNHKVWNAGPVTYPTDALTRVTGIVRHFTAGNTIFGEAVYESTVYLGGLANLPSFNVYDTGATREFRDPFRQHDPRFGVPARGEPQKIHDPRFSFPALGATGKEHDPEFGITRGPKPIGKKHKSGYGVPRGNIPSGGLDGMKERGR